MSNILLTGITGLVGSAVVTELLTKNPEWKVIAMVRGNARESAAERTEKAIREQCVFDGAPETAEDILSRIESVNCDVSNMDVESFAASLKGRVDTIFHCAADVNLGKDLKGETYRNNVESTKNLLSLAKGLGVGEFHLVSTSYVAGKFVGVAMEDKLHDVEFNNSYERSKHDAEVLVRGSGLRFSIYRPSIIVGRLCDGRIRRPLAFYRILDFFARIKKHRCSKIGMSPAEWGEMPFRLEARPSEKVYFVPIDYVQHTIAALFEKPVANKTYHITGNSPTSTKEIERVISISLKIRGLEVQEDIKDKTMDEKLVNKLVGDLTPYFSSEITFDTSNVVAQLGTEGLDWKLCGERLHTLIREYYRTAFPEIKAE